MTPEILKVYADTSVYGGAFDEEFSSPSRHFFDQVRERKFLLVVSALVRDELRDAPRNVTELFEEMSAVAEAADAVDPSVYLMDCYLHAGIVPDSARTDALHVALATTSDCRAIVSWNFKHIVHFNKIPLYNAVNRVNGYGEIAIHTPQEVIGYEDQDI